MYVWMVVYGAREMEGGWDGGNEVKLWKNREGGRKSKRESGWVQKSREKG